MKTVLIMSLLLIIPFVQSAAHASELGCAVHFPKVSADLAQYDATLLRMRSERDPAQADPTDMEWVKNKLQFMEEIDQFLSTFIRAHQSRTTILKKRNNASSQSSVLGGEALIQVIRTYSRSY